MIDINKMSVTIERGSPTTNASPGNEAVKQKGPYPLLG